MAGGDGSYYLEKILIFIAFLVAYNAAVIIDT